jgi:hypothetical protein
MSKDFYKSAEYRAKQSALTKRVWQLGRFDSVYKKIKKQCRRKGCENIFDTQPSDSKIYCSQRCAALVNSPGRLHSDKTKKKITFALTGRKYPNRKKEPPRFSICKNPMCQKEFIWRYWRPASNPIIYCSRICLMKDVGSRPTSPKAARAKAGIRLDIDPKIYFFSRWEANFARILDLMAIKWVHQPARFQLKVQKYTPDFYLPDFGIYVEIKNYLSEYSSNRDSQFRELYPHLNLSLILKPEYLKLQEKFAPLIKEWEYS